MWNIQFPKWKLTEQKSIRIPEGKWKVIEDILAYLSENKPENTPVQHFKSADALFVPHHRHPEVIEHALKLWKAKKVTKIVIVGKSFGGLFGCKYVPYALKAGIPPEALLVENKTTNISDGVQKGIAMCHANGFQPHRIIICSFPPHLQRLYATFKMHYPKIRLQGSGFNMLSERWLYEPKLIGQLLRELEHLRSDSQNGKIAKLIIPAWVETAEKKARKTLGRIEKFIKRDAYAESP